MRHAISPTKALPLLAECIRPGFARHRALSRAGGWTATGTKPTRRRLETAAWTPASDTPSTEDGISGSNGTPNGIDVAREMRHWQKVRRRLERNGQELEDTIDREQRFWRHHDRSARTSDLKVDYGVDRYRKPEDLRRMLDSNPTAVIYQRMRFSASRGEVANVQRMVAFLLKERGERPNLRMYANLILSHTSATQGSAQWVASYLRELKEEGLEPDAGLCHDALKALSVHPEFRLRSEILDYMRAKWFSLSHDGHHDVVAGLLRDGQLELATEMLENMPKSGIAIKSWLNDMAVHILCNAGEFEEALRIMQSRINAAEQDISQVVWFRLLETATNAFHYEGTAFVWKRRVQQSYLNPPTGICLNTLKIAAQRGDVDLATDVFRVLGQRNAVFEHEHYELLMEAYIRAKDVFNAFSLLCVMHDTQANPDLGSTRALVLYLRYNQKRREDAIEVLRQLKDSRTVPVVAMNAVIEGAVAASQVDEAVEYYKDMHDICADGRNIDTFNILLRGCRGSGRKDIAMFLASEMVALGIKPNTLTYDRLILVCLKETNFEDAFRYYFEMHAQGLKPRMGTVFFLAKRAAHVGDARTRRLLDDMESYGEEAKRPRAWIEQMLAKAEREEGEEKSNEADHVLVGAA